MKKIFLLTFVLASLITGAQVDSARKKLSITAQNRDCQFLLAFSHTNTKYARLNRDDTENQNIFQSLRKFGKDRANKELDENFNN